MPLYDLTFWQPHISTSNWLLDKYIHNPASHFISFFSVKPLEWRTPDRPDFPKCPPPAPLLLFLSGSGIFASFQSSWSFIFDREYCIVDFWDLLDFKIHDVQNYIILYFVWVNSELIWDVFELQLDYNSDFDYIQGYVFNVIDCLYIIRYKIIYRIYLTIYIFKY